MPGQPGQPGQSGQQPGFGFPQAPPLQAYGPGGYGGPDGYGGYGGPGPLTMPSTVRAAQVLTWVVVALQLLGAAMMFGLGALVADDEKNGGTSSDGTSDTETVSIAEELGFGAEVFYAFGVFALVWLVFAAFLGTRFSAGRNGMRVTIMIFGIVTAVLALYPFTILGLLHLVPAVLIAVFTGNSAGSAWFNRPRA
ncbi:hypothetical protein [Streptomyces yaizuensis]|uniref:Proline-rich domain-containing protein n=1 Tax=Streptomyces yaizuensis TaxID=2989713 RepID=A0ABQ5P616_9ACTN|nr:hypothetical protein [Streptomyces sp. YSPA8]GLF97671.1 proline-rich domain-containing protein [Streptomyces sp. YSPA8]